MLRPILLSCGVLASILYVVADAVGAASWSGYDRSAQAISELTALAAPTRALLVGPFLGYDALMCAFGCGVASASSSRAIRVCGVLLAAVGVVGLVATSAFPMHLRGTAPSVTDTMHIILTALTVACIAGAMLSAAIAVPGLFRWWSLLALAVTLASGALAGVQGTDIAAGRPTPLLGVFERASVGTYLLWVAVLAVALLRRPGTR